MIIGICGKSGSGKSTFANKIIKCTNNRAVHLDIDKVGHKVLLLPEVKEELVNTFGDVLTNGNVDRKKLGNIVFSSEKEMNKLTAITWKYMQIEIDNFINENKDRIVILDWLLLVKTEYFNMCDMKILLDVPYEVRKERTMKRDNITSEAFDLRESSSINYDQSAFDYVVHGENKDLLRRVARL